MGCLTKGNTSLNENCFKPVLRKILNFVNQGLEVRKISFCLATTLNMSQPRKGTSCAFRDSCDRVSLAPVMMDNVQQEGSEWRSAVQQSGRQQIQWVSGSLLTLRCLGSAGGAAGLCLQPSRAGMTEQEPQHLRGQTWALWHSSQPVPPHGICVGPSHSECGRTRTLPHFFHGGFVLALLWFYYFLIGPLTVTAWLVMFALLPPFYIFNEIWQRNKPNMKIWFLCVAFSA